MSASERVKMIKEMLESGRMVFSTTPRSFNNWYKPQEYTKGLTIEGEYEVVIEKKALPDKTSEEL